MKPIQIISQDLFDKVRSRFQNLEMGDETGAVTIDPAEARFFDFDFVLEGNDFGRVSISLNDLGSLKIYYSQGITEHQDDPAKRLWYNFLKEMRQFAMRRLLRFDTRDIVKTNLDRNDFQYLATKGSKDEDMTQMNESRWSQRSTKKTSRAVKGTTEVIVRHNRSVDEMYPGARSQKKNIKAIFIQNKDGERFKYPFIHPAGAFAMAQHVDHGGVPHDPAGKAIMRMSEQIAQLQEFQRQVQRTQLHDDAMGIADRAHSRLMELRSMVEALGKRHHYENWVADFNETEDDGLAELDPVTMEEYKTKFTQTNFKEELAQFFPLIHKIMQETNAIDLEEYVGEGEECPKCHQDPCECDEVKEGVDDFSQFEEWAEAVEQGKLTDDQIVELKQALADLQVPLDLDTAYNFFNEFGIEDYDLENKLQQAKELDPETDALEVFQLWAKENYPELLVALGMSGTQPPQEQPQGTMEDLQADDGEHYEDSADFFGQFDSDTFDDEETSPDGMEVRGYIDGVNVMAWRFDDESMTSGYGVFDDSGLGETAEEPTAGPVDQKSVIQEVAKIVKQFYNKDNPEVGPFRGEEGILLDIEKQISEKFGEEMGHQARQVAEKFMEKLTNEWQDRHGETKGVAGDGLARLKELANVIKTKVEGIGDQGHGGEDFNKNIMPAEEGLDSEKRAKLDDLIDKYRTSSDPEYDYYGVDDHHDPDEIIAQIRSEFGDKVASDVEAGTEKMHFPRHGIQRSDPLGWKNPVDRATKAGKMYKQDSDYRKNAIKSRYQNSGRSATENVAETSDLGRILKLSGLAK